jgi:ABC-type nickel/cobalt efflux system permease component RcnA
MTVSFLDFVIYTGKGFLLLLLGVAIMIACLAAFAWVSDKVLYNQVVRHRDSWWWKQTGLVLKIIGYGIMILFGVSVTIMACYGLGGGPKYPFG